LPQNAKIGFKTFAMIYVDVHGIFMTGELLLRQSNIGSFCQKSGERWQLSG
jgi:hypothetical protein